MLFRSYCRNRMIANTVANSDAEMKLADFGLARRISSLRAGEAPCGSPCYVSPEILEGRLYGAETDVWSTGVIMYCVLVGHPPFEHDDPLCLFELVKIGTAVYSEISLSYGS